MKVCIWIVFLSLCLATSCSAEKKKLPPPDIEKTTVQIQEFQKRTFNEPNIHLTMKRAIYALQEDGFTVKNVALDLGFLTATKEIDIENSSTKRWNGFVFGKEGRWIKQRIIEATINISQLETKTGIRVSFLSKEVDNKGNLICLEHLDEEKLYQEFFKKMHKSVL